MPKASHTTRSDGQPVNKRTTQNPDPKAGRTPGSPSIMTRGRLSSGRGWARLSPSHGRPVHVSPFGDRVRLLRRRWGRRPL